MPLREPCFLRPTTLSSDVTIVVETVLETASVAGLACNLALRQVEGVCVS